LTGTTWCTGVMAAEPTSTTSSIVNTTPSEAAE
jgi:hypothetical protein